VVPQPDVFADLRRTDARKVKMKTLDLGRMAVGLALIAAYGACGSGPADEGVREPSPASAERQGPSKKRLFLDNHSIDDATRAERLVEIIATEGVRCEAADKVVEVSSGSWTVRCRGGAVFRVIFDRSGRVAAVRRID
jgi:hypothetical protein